MFPVARYDLPDSFRARQPQHHCKKMHAADEVLTAATFCSSPTPVILRVCNFGSFQPWAKNQVFMNPMSSLHVLELENPEARHMVCSMSRPFRKLPKEAAKRLELLRSSERHNLEREIYEVYTDMLKRRVNTPPPPGIVWHMQQIHVHGMQKRSGTFAYVQASHTRTPHPHACAQAHASTPTLTYPAANAEQTDINSSISS